MVVITFLQRVLDLMNTLPKPALQCHLTLDFYRELVWKIEFSENCNGECDFTDCRSVTNIFTDSSNIGFNAVCNNDWFFYNLLADFSSLAFIHINYKEALCIVFALIHCGPSLRNNKVIHSDNTTAVAIINKDTTKKSQIMHYITFSSMLFKFLATAIS